MSGRRVKFIRFHGNRFNVIFLLAEVLYYHRNDVIKFFEEIHIPSNKLQKAVLMDAKEKILISGCKVLGLISKLVTAPLWRVLESGTHILQMNDHYHVLLQYLDRISKDPAEFLLGDCCAFNEQYIHRDEVFECLVQPNDDIDHYAEQIVKTLATALHSLLERMVGDHLPGGKFSNITEELKIKTASVIPHNKLPEFAFGVLDFQLRYRPNASTLVNEAFLMYSMNKTSEWLKSLSDEEKTRLMRESRRDGRKYRETFKARVKEIQEERRKRLAEKAAEAARKNEIQRKKREEIVANILYDGLWQSEEQINEALGIIKSNKDKRAALIWQLKFRKTILQQKYHDKTVYNFSKKGTDNKYKDLTISELKDNLKKLLDESFKGPHSERERRGVPLLVGKRIEHQFQDETYIGRVISVVPGYPDWYNVVYDNDVAVYTYKLLDDYRNKDLKIIPEADTCQEVFKDTVAAAVHALLRMLIISLLFRKTLLHSFVL
ncbi:uncharacterized protein LOC132738872 [Ruditapes philippinarum]|uniref:uncharacterized protein LOC132738872 n=1 Tax=Ruditapes philippinarum TaxID=129788 RepID=UPI00295AB0B2|nr:uncharacterized protein LOC132738872 [Ruditapes philippinarum]